MTFEIFVCVSDIILRCFQKVEKDDEMKELTKEMINIKLAELMKPPAIKI